MTRHAFDPIEHHGQSIQHCIRSDSDNSHRRAHAVTLECFCSFGDSLISQKFQPIGEHMKKRRPAQTLAARKHLNRKQGGCHHVQCCKALQHPPSKTFSSCLFSVPSRPCVRVFPFSVFPGQRATQLAYPAFPGIPGSSAPGAASSGRRRSGDRGAPRDPGSVRTPGKTPCGCRGCHGSDDRQLRVS